LDPSEAESIMELFKDKNWDTFKTDSCPPSPARPEVESGMDQSEEAQAESSGNGSFRMTSLKPYEDNSSSLVAKFRIYPNAKPGKKEEPFNGPDMSSKLSPRGGVEKIASRLHASPKKMKQNQLTNQKSSLAQNVRRISWINNHS